MRMIYFCNNPRNPSGGINVIYRHVHQLNLMGIPAFIMQSRQGFGHQHAKHGLPSVSNHDIRENDYFMIPEISVAEIASQLIPNRISYGIFVQNGYYLSHRSRDYTEQHLDTAYQQANNIFAISKDTSEVIKLRYPQIANRIFRISCSIDPKQFYMPIQKEKLITYMPRKNSTHSEALIFALKKNVPDDWRIVAIDNLSQLETAILLRQSAIFLSFSNLEGLGLPPIEAALCGNFVIGYHGGGGLDYWLAPNFTAVSVGDFVDFIDKIKRLIIHIQQESYSPATVLQPGITALQNTYSENNEKHYLLKLSELAHAAVAGKSNRNVAICLQSRASFLHSLLGRRHTRQHRKSGWKTYTN